MFRVYIACLAAYNNGIMHGEWVEVSGDVDELKAEIARILKDSPEEDAEEWAIHDSEGFGSYHVSEWADLEDLCDYVTTLSETSHDVELIDGVICDRGCTAREAIAYIDDHYQGEYESLEHWAEQFLQETDSISLSKDLQYYFDYERYGRDREMEGSIFTVQIGSAVHVLWNS